jgi:YD repeat-containing protein
VLLVSAVGCVGALLVALTMGTPSNAKTSAAPAASLRPASNPTGDVTRLGDEVASARTATSRTFRSVRGSMTTRVYPMPVNYRSGGGFRLIDPTLVAAPQAGYVHRRANSGDALVPTDLRRPLKLVNGDRWLSYALHGAAGAGRVTGDEASFAAVLPGVDARYRSTTTGVKEQLSLADAKAQSRFSYEVKASDGLRADRRPDGSIAFLDGSDRVVFAIGAPVIWDGAATPSVSHASKLALTRTSEGWTIGLAVDQQWLHDSARRFPVVVDPDLQFIDGGWTRFHGAERDCTVTSGASASTSFCADPSLTVGSTASATSKALLFFDLRSTIPQHAVVSDAELIAYTADAPGAAVSTLGARPLTASWTSAATWDTRDGATAWATGGGDVSAAVADASSTGQVGGSYGSWFGWIVPTDLVQRWVTGETAENGLQLAAEPGSPTAQYTFTSTEGDSGHWPAIDISWDELQGLSGPFTQDSQLLGDGSQLSVNVANGALTYRANDVSLPGTDGMDLDVARQWNSASWEDQWRSQYGQGWFAGLGETWIDQPKDGGVYLMDETGTPWRFGTDGAGGYTSPPAIDAQLCTIEDTGTSCTRDGVDGGAHYKLTYTTSGRKLYFATGGPTLAVKDANNNMISADWGNSAITFSATQDRSVSLHVGPYGYADTMTDGTHTAHYTLDAATHTYLTSVQDVDGNTTCYEYNDAGYLTKITDPQGRQTRIEWEQPDWYGPGKLTSWRISKIIRVLDPTDPTNPANNPTTTYSYDLPNRTTVVTDPAGNATTTPTDDGQTTYTYDKLLHVTHATPLTSALPASPAWPSADADWDTTRPSSEPSGAWFDLAGGYVNGQGQHTLTLASTDPAAPSGSGAISGVRRLAIEEVGSTEIAAATPTCTITTRPPITCPTTANPTVTVDATTLSEGAHAFRQVTQDLAGNTSGSAPWTVSVDRTAPSAPTGFQQGLFYPADPDHVVTISWAESVDPDLPGSVPGSGTATYHVRYSVNGGTQTAWAPADGPNVEVPNAGVGNSVAVEATATDAVGNVSSVGSAVVTITARGEDPVVEDMAAQFIVDNFGGTLEAAKAWYGVQVRSNEIGEAIGTTNSGPGYAGTWFNNTTRKMVINLKTGTPTSGAQTAIDNAGLTNDSQIEFVSYSLDQLDQAFPQVASQLSDLLSDQLIELSRDDQSSVLHIDVGTNTTPAQRAEIDDAAAAAPVTVTVAMASFANFQTVNDSCSSRLADGSGTRKVPVCDDPLRGGTHIAGYTADAASEGHGRCTAAFNVKSRTTGKPYVLTAGHCFNGYDNDNSVWKAFPLDLYEGLTIGPNHNPYINNETGDAGLITVSDDSPWWTTPLKPKPWVFIQASKAAGQTRRTEHYRIRSVSTSRKNETLCWSGATTGGHCGLVIEQSSNNARLGVMDVRPHNSECVQGGDSGSPVVLGGSARGIITSHTALQPCHVYYQSARLAQDRLNVDILTTSSP